MWKELVPSRNRARLALGKLKQAGDDAQRRRAWSESIPLYRQYLALRSDDVAIWVQLGHALKESGDLSGAENAYRQAMMVAPDDSDSRLHLVALLRRMEKLAEADLLEREARATGSLPSTMGGSGSRAAAVRLSAKATDRARGDLARNDGDWPRAAQFYINHLKSVPTDAAIWVQLGHALKEQSLLDDALYAYTIASHLDGGNLDTLEHLSKILGTMGRSSGSLPLWASLFDIPDRTEP